MAMVRDVTVGFRGANNKIEKVSDAVPADWIIGDRDALAEIYDNPKLRTRISVAEGAAIWAQIGDPYDDTPQAYRIAHF
jgi:hypothetical protein